MELKFQQIINAIHLVQEDLNIVKARQEQISGEVSNVKSELIISKSGVQQRDHNRFCPPLSANTNTSDGSFFGSVI
jgi:FtsZ-binding cell division protein ZapB